VLRKFLLFSFESIHLKGWREYRNLQLRREKQKKNTYNVIYWSFKIHSAFTDRPYVYQLREEEEEKISRFNENECISLQAPSNTYKQAGL